MSTDSEVSATEAPVTDPHLVSVTPRFERRWSRAPVSWAAAAIALLLPVAAILRVYAIGRAYDLDQDEVDYVVLSTSLRHGTFPPVFPGSGPFLLHPPLFFAMSAAWERLLPVQPGWWSLLDAVRLLNALCAVISAGALFAIGRRLANEWVGVAAAAIFVIDPYVLRQNGRALLETSTMMFVLVGYAVLARLWHPPDALGSRRRPGWRPVATAAAAGVLLGLSIVGKDMALLLVAPPLVVLAAAGWGVPRRLSLTALGAAAVPYCGYLAALGAVGSIGAWWAQETNGFARFVGAQKSTGFSKAGSPSLVHTLLAQVTSFGPTYVVVAAGLVATAYLLVLALRPSQRFWAVVSACGAGTVLYATFFGTIEEQFLYYLLVPAILALVLAAHVLLQRRRAAASSRHRSGSRRWRWVRPSVAVGLLAVLCTYDFGVWVATRTSPDNGEQRLTAWFHQHVVAPGLIDSDTQVTVYALQLTGLRSASVGSLPQAAADHVRYLTVLPVETAGNYANLTTAQDRAFERHGRLVWSFHEATYGDMQIWETTNPRIW